MASLLGRALLTGLVASLVSPALAILAKRDTTDPISLNLTGHIEPDKVMTFVHEPFEVPPGVSSISVSYSYSSRGQGNALDIGIFDQRGFALPDPNNGTFGSRGWSGGFRDSLVISEAWATPGYNPGPISPGTWYIVFGPYSSTDDGIDWNASVEMTFEETAAEEWFSPAYAASSLDQSPIWERRQEQQQPRWLRGDFHLHTVYSDGRYLPEEQVANAIARKLDFIFFSEHNTYSGNDVYGLAQPSGSDLLIGRAIEVTTRYGHWNAIGLDRGQNIEWRYHPEDGDEGYPAAAAQVHRAGGIVSVNHPFAACGRCDWVGLGWDHNDAIEVWNGPWDVTDQMAVDKWHEFLVEGRRYIAIGGSDAHRDPDVTGLPTTVVLSRGLSQSAIVDGVLQGFAYLVKEPEMTMSLTIKEKDKASSSYHIGQTVKSSKVHSKAELQVAGFGTNGTMVSWISEKGYESNVTLSKETEKLKFDAKKVKKFLRAEVRDVDDNLLGLTNPIFFE